MTDVKIPPPRLGVDLLSAPSQAKAGTLRDAVNLDILTSGAFRRRGGFQSVLAGEGMTGMYAIPKGLIVARSGELYLIKEDNSAISHIYGMQEQGPVDFTEYNGDLYILGKRVFCWLRGMQGRVAPVGVALPDALPDIQSHGAGVMPEGDYAVAISVVDEYGEESPTKLLGTLHLVGGIRLDNLQTRPGYKYRVYASPPNGEVMYLVSEFDADVSMYFVMDRPTGPANTTLHLAPMPPGDFVRGSRGRLYVATGDTLVFSDAMRPRLTDPRTNFIKFTGDIRFVEPVDAGIYVGDSAGVWWLAGTDPSKFTVLHVSESVPVKRSSLIVASADLPEQFRDSEHDCAVWLSSHGYVVGSPDGKVTPLHPERVRLAADLEGNSVFMARQGVKQVVTLTAAANPQGHVFGVTPDPLIQ